MHIFARLTKVNETDRTVEGIIANEALDRSGEIFDYDSSKPHFIKWSESIAKATDGKNLGNVRAMHGNVSAGITKALNFDDEAKHITVKAEITDDNEWRKVLKGNYTGFSIGGGYGKKWTDQALSKTRYEAIPSEYSLVDLPCNQEATFTVVKSDGAEEMRKFETAMDNADALAKWADGLSDAERAVILEKISKRPDVDPKEGEGKYGDVEYADPVNKKYPIDTDEHIRAAWNYIHKGEDAAKYGESDVAAIKDKIVAAWKDKIDAAGPPSAEKMAADELAKAGKRHSAKDQAALDQIKAHNEAIGTHHAAIAQHQQGIADCMQSLGAPATSDDGSLASGDPVEADQAQKLAKAADDLTKVTSERDELRKSLDAAQVEIEKLKAEPVPPKGVIKAVSKTDDGDDLEPPAIDDKPVLKADGTTDHQATASKLMKLALSRPLAPAGH